MALLLEFESIAAEVGIAMPSELKQLFASGKTIYGPDWKNTWRQRCLTDPPPLISCYDFEWIDAAQSRDILAQWLNPALQQGRAFLPFAVSGAGDAYCLMASGSQCAAVALIRHDAPTSQLHSQSFRDFVCTQLLCAMADLSHHAELLPHEVHQMVRADVTRVSQFMDVSEQQPLRAWCEQPPVWRQCQSNCRSLPYKVLSYLSQDQLDLELAKFAPVDPAQFAVTARWEMAAAPQAAMLPKSWRDHASDPKHKFAAIQAYQREHGASLLQAKQAVDAYTCALNRGPG